MNVIKGILIPRAMVMVVVVLLAMIATVIVVVVLRDMAIIAIIVLVFLLVISLLFLCYYRHRSKKNIEDHNLLMVLKRLPGTPREFKFKDLNKATNNFNENMKLGQGGFGVVYKGVLLVGDENTQLVAVKKFSRESNKGIADFIAELTIINRLRHKHLVPLIGWCHKKGRLLLVYEYMPNGSLDNHLFGGPEKTLSWEHRYKIIYGVASALHYLHKEYDQKVVHRDLKASNIMLDSDFNARLGDFGLARAIENERTSYAELEGVPGTVGYIAPECLHTGKATRQSDVFGFGAVILEVVCGQRPWTRIAGFTYLVDWVWKLYREGRILEALDVRLGNDYLLKQVERLVLLGLACSHPIASERPRTETIVQIISGSAPTPIVPHFKPAFVWPTTLDTLEEEEKENISIRTPEILSHGFARTANIMKREAGSDKSIPRADVWVRSYCKKDGSTSSCVSSELEMIREAAKGQTSETSEDLLNDPLTKVFGRDYRGRVRAIGTTVSRSQVQGAIPTISKMNKKIIQHELLRNEWEEYKGHLDQSMGEICVMCQTILNNQKSTLQTQSSSATQQSCGEVVRRERKCNLTDWRRTIVAMGRVIEGEGQTVVHGDPLSEEDCRVVLDAIYKPDSPLPTSSSFAETLGEVGVGGHTAWPKAFIKFL